MMIILKKKIPHQCWKGICIETKEIYKLFKDQNPSLMIILITKMKHLKIKFFLIPKQTNIFLLLKRIQKS